MLLLDVLDKIFGMFPVTLIGVERKYFIFLCAIGYRLFFALNIETYPNIKLGYLELILSSGEFESLYHCLLYTSCGS